MTINPDQFAKIAESLRQYRRAELTDFQEDLGGGNPIDALYVDPLPSEAVLKTLMQSNTTFLVGRKGTGKSTIFAKTQFELRKKTDVISVYIDVKSLHEVLTTFDVVSQITQLNAEISTETYQAHRLRKLFLATIISELINELKNAYEKQSLIARWKPTGRKYTDVIRELQNIAEKVKNGDLTEEEIPVLKVISSKSKNSQSNKKSTKLSADAEAKISANPSLKITGGIEKFDESIGESDLYQAYSDIVLRSFPFQEILAKIKELLAGVELKRLFVFFDDFSELSWVEQKLFVDVILSPLNNSSDETVKLKVAGYPGRIYYGKIDPGKVDTIGLDFYQIYKSHDVQTSEASAIECLQRLLETRFDAFNQNIGDYFNSSLSMDEYYRLLFEVTLNVPRLVGYILHACYFDKISRGEVITSSAIKLAAQKYYDSITTKYFDRMNRFAMEPFERKLDRHNQQKLLEHVSKEAKTVQRSIASKKVGGQYFHDLTNPPTSHFTVSPSMEDMFSSLELNFMVTKYHEMRDKDGRDVSVYALSYGLCEDQRMSWGYPRGRHNDRSYFVQRCFSYNSSIKEFLVNSQTIRCDNCGASFGMGKRESIEFYGWKCPECQVGICKVITLGDEFKQEVDLLDEETMLPAIELEILETLNEEAAPMRAGEVAALIDTTYQMVGRRTGKLLDMGLVDKQDLDGAKRSSITSKAKYVYFEKKVKGGN